MSQHIHLKPLNEVLKNLKPDAQPQWGRMTPQHMVEHLTNSVNGSNGRVIMNALYPEERLEKAKAFLMSNRPMPRGISNNPGADLPALRNENLEKAIEELQEAVHEFEEHHLSNQDSRYTHPAFGELNKDEWNVFHDKHFRHHLSQFGLLD
ncbi:MAG: DUF1569 domain-containing protein [Bacteroidia bacterium]